MQAQAYDYLTASSEAGLIANLRRQLVLNKVTLSDAEWGAVLPPASVAPMTALSRKPHRLQEDHAVLKRDDIGTTKNIYLIDKANIHNNTLQVIKSV